VERPWWKFYGRDWLNDLELNRCCIAARGLWIAMLSLMNEGTPYGHLADKRGPISPKALAAKQQISVGQCHKLLSDLEENFVFGRTESGIIFSRRMVRDERLNRARAAGGIKSIEHPNTPKPKGTHNGSVEGCAEIIKDKGAHPPDTRASDSDSASGVDLVLVNQKDEFSDECCGDSFQSYFGIFIATGKPLNDSDMEACLKVWISKIPDYRRAAFTDAKRQSLAWRGDKYTPFPVNHLEKHEWTRKSNGRAIPLVERSVADEALDRAALRFERERKEGKSF